MDKCLIIAYARSEFETVVLVVKKAVEDDPFLNPG